MSSAGMPTRSTARPLISAWMRERFAAVSSWISASTTSRSVPLRASVAGNTATPPRRTPAQPAHRLLQFLRIEVAAAADDDVLLAPGEVELAGREVAEVAGVEPAAVEEAPGSLRDCGSSRASPTAPGTARAPRVRSGSSRPSASTMRIAWPGKRQPAGNDALGMGVSAAAGRAMPLRDNSARSTRSISGPRPSGGKARPTADSARP